MSDGGEEEVRYIGGHPGDGGKHVGQIPLGPLCHLYPSPAAPASRFFSPRRSKTTTLYTYTKTQHHEGVVYIQIIRWSKCLCVITEAQNNLRNIWIL